MGNINFLNVENNLTEIANYAVKRGWSLANGDDAFTIRKFGQNLEIDTAAEEDIWEIGGTRAIFTAAEQFNIASTSTADDIGSTGALTMRIEGLDGDYNYVTEDVNLDGTTNVLTTNSYIEIYRMRVLTSGTGQINAGLITATGASSSNVIAGIRAGYGTTQQTHFVIPAGYTGFLIEEGFSSFKTAGGTGSGRVAEVYQRSLSNGSNTILRGDVRGIADYTESVSLIPARYPEKTLGWYSATVDTNDTIVTVQWELVCIKTELCN